MTHDLPDLAPTHPGDPTPSDKYTQDSHLPLRPRDLLTPVLPQPLNSPGLCDLLSLGLGLEEQV